MSRIATPSKPFSFRPAGIAERTGHLPLSLQSHVEVQRFLLGRWSPRYFCVNIYDVRSTCRSATLFPPSYPAFLDAFRATSFKSQNRETSPCLWGLNVNLSSVCTCLRLRPSMFARVRCATLPLSRASGEDPQRTPPSPFAIQHDDRVEICKRNRAHVLDDARRRRHIVWCCFSFHLASRTRTRIAGDSPP